VALKRKVTNSAGHKNKTPSKETAQTTGGLLGVSPGTAITTNATFILNPKPETAVKTITPFTLVTLPTHIAGKPMPLLVIELVLIPIFNICGRFWGGIRPQYAEFSHLLPCLQRYLPARASEFSLVVVYRQSGRLNCNLVEKHG
jgi:hypothetical protein